MTMSRRPVRAWRSPRLVGGALALACLASGLAPAAPAVGVTAVVPAGLTAREITTVSAVGTVDDAGSGLGSAPKAAMLQLYAAVAAAATSIVAGQLQPGGGSSGTSNGSEWKPPADLQTPPIAPALPPAAAAPPRPRQQTKYEVLGSAYTQAAQTLSDRCHLPFALLLAIGEVESSSLRGRNLDAAGDVVPPVIGPALSGGGFAAIGDSDGGRLDGDTVWDRAVGPMQFIPGTWRIWGADGNGDGIADPQNVHDAALAAGRYLCAGGRDLSRRADVEQAILSYNHSKRYLQTVLQIFDSVSTGLVAGP